MSLISFTSNFKDCCTDHGYQFEFYCDGCGNGHMSRFKESKLGMAGSFLRAAGGLFGSGAAGNAAQAGDTVRDALRGRARDEALAEAVAEAKKEFKQCPRCGKWVCPQACWNPKKGQCDKCAPDLEDEIAAAQATAQKEQVWRKARETDLVAEIDVRAEGGVAGATCGSCGARGQTGKFCAECGKAVGVKQFCTGCGAEVRAGSKFCGGCGKPVG
ncbi:MAG: zinc ribbon domain-containing protein [Phycisphaerae bacterium]|nr:zinc ribbon domain-containing protein [Phycisphaerae bacterium]